MDLNNLSEGFTPPSSQEKPEDGQGGKRPRLDCQDQDPDSLELLLQDWDQEDGVGVTPSVSAHFVCRGRCSVNSNLKLDRVGVLGSGEMDRIQKNQSPCPHFKVWI